MKKIISVLLAVVMTLCVAFAFASCSSKKYNDTEATIPVTDENGVTVTDKNGNVVTETKAKESAQSDNSSSESNKDQTTEKNSSTKKGETTKSKTSTSKASKKASSSKKDETTSAKKETTTKETTTEKPEKREVFVRVEIPTSSDLKETKLTVKYKTEKDDEYRTLKIDDPNDKKKQLDYEIVKLDGKTVKKYSLGKIKGEVKVKVSLSGVELTGNSKVIKSNENSVTISPASGIDIVVGEND